ncbi:AsmA family protein [Phenylobacterium immobile]|uniref:AsmA family protein n=1 Tax=Phenylobacterium immobile TaxID=21 RepID=UPI000A597905|nr:AsmA family protein [Phenylobacterium immobile]
MSQDAFHDLRPGRRKPSGEVASRSGRRPLARAGAWTQARFVAARERIVEPRHRGLKIAGAVLAVLTLALIILIAIWDWNWFRGPIGRLASARMHREVTLEGDLKAHPFSWQPWATAEDIRVKKPAWAGAGDMARVDRLSVRIRLLPLLKGDVDLPLLQFDRPVVTLLRDEQGRASWDFSDGRPVTEPLKLPPIRNFVIKDGKLSVTDQIRGLSFEGTINAAEQLGARSRGFALVGQGRFNREAFKLDVTGGPLLNIDKSRPYPFNAELRSGRTTMTAVGAVPKPFDLGQFHMNASLKGQDLADLYALTGVALPNTPPYSLRGRLERDGLLYKVNGLDGRVGSSDLSGAISVNTAGERPMLRGKLKSNSLDFADLGALFGGAPVTGQVASPEQAAIARDLRAQQRMMPDTTLAVDRIRAMDADVDYRAESIRNTPVQLRSAVVHVKLDNGLLRAEPLRLDLPQGRVSGYIQLNARRALPVTDLDLRLSNARLEQLVPVKFDGRSPFQGGLVARARLTGTGNSVHKAFASSNGEVMVAIPGGEIRKAFAELMGVNVVKGLGLLLSDDQSSTPIRCGVARLDAKGGVFEVKNLVFDTGPVVVSGAGRINMATERLDLRVKGHPKKFRLVRAIVPITVKGPLMASKVGVEPGAAIAQGGVAVALGTLLTPLAAILPFIDPGLAKDANCAALISEAGRQGAPVATVRH